MPLLILVALMRTIKNIIDMPTIITIYILAYLFIVFMKESKQIFVKQLFRISVIK